MKRLLLLIIIASALVLNSSDTDIAYACHGLDPGQTCADTGQGYAAACDDQCMPSQRCLDSVPANGYPTDYGPCGREPDTICGGWGACRKRNNEARDFGCNSGYYKCGGACCPSAPPCNPNQGQACQSGTNICGMFNSGTIQCSGSCSVSTPPNSACPAPSCSAAPANQRVGLLVTATGSSGVPGYTWNSGGGAPAGGAGNPASFTYATPGAKTITINDSNGKSSACGITICTVNFGTPCTSTANACGQTSPGTFSCNGTCSAVPPPISGCPPPQCSVIPASAMTGQSVTATGVNGIPPYSWNTGGGVPASGAGPSRSAIYASQGVKTFTITDSNAKAGTCNVAIGGAFTTTAQYSTPQGALDFNTSYTVRLTVWDSSDQASVPVTFDYATHEEWVKPLFTLTPPKPAAGQEITFTDTTDYGGDTPGGLEWDFGDGSPIDTTSPAALHTYVSEIQNITVTLRARSSSMPNGTYCSVEQQVDVLKAIPGYREVRPGTQTSPREEPGGSQR